MKSVHTKDILTYAGGGILFCIIFYIEYQAIPSSWYQQRDDALITLSHARNWVEYGVIGVSPSGGKVEGFSAPFSFLIYTFLFAICKMHYHIFFALQTWICTFLLGVLCSLFSKKSLLITAIGAILLTRCAEFFLWHGSGMENPINHVCIGLAIWSLIEIYKKNYHWKYAIPIAISMLVRVDSLYYILPLLITVVLVKRNHTSLSSTLRFSALCLLPVFVLHLSRWWYFGSLIPNTAFAQQIDIIARLGRLWSGDQEIWHYSIFLGIELLLTQGIIFFLIFIPWIPCLWKHKDFRFILVLLCVFTILVGLTPFLFGTARLSPGRITTTASVVFILCIVYGCSLLGNIRHRILALLSLLVIAFIPNIPFEISKRILPKTTIQHNTGFQFSEPKRICCDTTTLAQRHKEFLSLRNQHDLYRPMIAIPDLGLISWHKDANILDLGRLGHPLLAQSDNKEFITHYILDIVAPDIIQSHSHWSCEYKDIIFSVPRFIERYKALYTDENPCPKGFSGVWIRKDIMKNSQSKERNFLDMLINDLSVQSINMEIENCYADSNQDCTYIARTILRFWPEINSRGLANTIIRQNIIQDLHNPLLLKQ